MGARRTPQAPLALASNDHRARRHCWLWTGNSGRLIFFFKEVAGVFRASNQGPTGRRVAWETVCLSFSVNMVLFSCRGHATARLSESPPSFISFFHFLLLWQLYCWRVKWVMGDFEVQCVIFGDFKEETASDYFRLQRLSFLLLMNLLVNCCGLCIQTIVFCFPSLAYFRKLVFTLI